MNAMKQEAPERQEIEELLPWHAAGTLSRRDAQRVEEALAQDPELARRYALVRDELGIAILLVEQSAAAALTIADHAYVMENGRIVLDGDRERLKSHQDVQEFYLGQASGERRSYRAVKQYRRSRRWYG